MLGRKVICVRCINCSYNNMAKDIRLLDKIAIFVCTEKKFIHANFKLSYVLFDDCIAPEIKNM